ncbi:hypothetical protein GW17_00014460 [Ensete ventricosum]|nr:hypothetical protein GW17_00014460 [Ensete ventricosum]RZR94672.1 hypothetical protein BHM03_00023425 [Ensete ventricosum]
MCVHKHLLSFFLDRSLGYGNDVERKPSQLKLVIVQATAGTLASACSSVITTPIDTVKTRLQVYLLKISYDVGHERICGKAISYEDNKEAPRGRWLERVLQRIWTQVLKHVTLGHLNDRDVRTNK